MSKRRGRYIVWEGLDGIGKSTQMAVAVRESRRRETPTLAVREPGGSDIGAAVRKLILDPDSPDLHLKTEVALFLAERAQLWYRAIVPALEAGYDVYSDRNWWSTVAYQGAGGELSADFIIAAHKLFMPEDYLRPTLGLVFNMSEKDRWERLSGGDVSEFGSLDRIEQKEQAYFERAAQEYAYILSELGGTGINATGKPEEVTARWWSYVFPEAT